MRLPRVLRLLVLVAVAAGCAIALARLDGHALRTALAGAALGPVVVAMALNLFLRTAARTRRTLVLLRALPDGSVGFGELFCLLLGGYAAGTILPGPAEEVLYTTALARRHGFRLRALLGTHAIDKALGIASMAAVALPILPAAAAIAVGGALALALLVARRPRLCEAFGWLVVSNLLSVAMVGLCCAAVGLHVGFVGCLRIFLATACASALGLVPGQIGVLETAFVLALTRFGVDPATALAAALLYHAAQVVPLVLAGLPVLVRESVVSA